MRVNEIFCSLQGEGHHTGTAAVFVRLAGCNLRCPFCDTDFEDYCEMSEEQIVAAVRQYAARHVVITGGEPLLQLTAELVDRLHDEGRYVQIETNGTRPLPDGCQPDWVTCSPKDQAVTNAPPVRLQRIDELKVVLQSEDQDLTPYYIYRAAVYSLQPCDTGNETTNRRLTAAAVAYCIAHPQWHLSLQTHKLLNIR